MAKGGLSKLKCMIKRWHSSSRISRTPSGCSAGSTSARSHGGGGRVGGEEWGRSVLAGGGGGGSGGGGAGGGLGGGRGGSVSFHGADGVPPGLHPVYVGKSRRRYLIAADLVGHPMFQNLVDRSGGGGVGAGGGTVVGCEVVLFEHLLWMLENADPQPESLDELVEYYAC
ncbi:serine, glycine and glutamine-rich protein-like [Oryza brachyantha]|uniref:serine, glycine and glutamine-rich protein-like n=1 Tax=Oryza brachyantha TaxID=4533 RepID=UPI001ADB0D52|nr:serine, glycine and glutamine-rich protein-like [Oryza brachyantha]